MRSSTRPRSTSTPSPGRSSGTRTIPPGADIAYVGAVRVALGPTAPLMSDANNAYTIADADHLARLDALELMMIE